MNTRTRSRSSKKTPETPQPSMLYNDEEEDSTKKDRSTEKNIRTLDDNKTEEEEDSDEDLTSFPIRRLSFSGNVDSTALLNRLRDRFKRKEQKWTMKAAWYARINLLLQFVILCMQVATLILHDFQQRSWMDTDTAKIIQSVLAAMSGVIISAQMKLRFGNKAEKYRKGAKIYGRMLRTTTYYDMMLKCGGNCEEIEKFWEECMRKEEEIPLPKSSSIAS